MLDIAVRSVKRKGPSAFTSETSKSDIGKGALQSHVKSSIPSNPKTKYEGSKESEGSVLDKLGYLQIENNVVVRPCVV